MFLQEVCQDPAKLGRPSRTWEISRPTAANDGGPRAAARILSPYLQTRKRVPTDSLAPRCATSSEKAAAIGSVDRTAPGGSGGPHSRRHRPFRRRGLPSSAAPCCIIAARLSSFAPYGGKLRPLRREAEAWLSKQQGRRSGGQPNSVPSPRPAARPPRPPPAVAPQEAASPSPCHVVTCSTPWPRTFDQGHRRAKLEQNYTGRCRRRCG